jgi:Calcineurin-like phosphoesterase
VPAPLFVVGDVHGHRDVLAALLRDAGLVDSAERWSGADAVVWLVGDLVDRGPDGIGAIDLVRRLERESDGSLHCLLGNHEALMLAVRRFGDLETSYPGTTFRDVWRMNGGLDSDLRALTPEHVDWVAARPAIGREGDWLLLHADTTAYLDYGDSAATVNRAVSAMLAEGTVDEVDELLGVLSDRMRLGDPDGVDALLTGFGGGRIVHGHTPIATVRGVDPHEVIGPLVYGGGRVMNVDHCLFAGGPGFVVRLDLVPPGAVAAR